MRRNLLTAGLVLLAGCNWWYDRVPSPDDLMKAVPWFDHMVGSRAVYPYQLGGIPRQTPPGTVPITGAEADWRAEFKRGVTTTADRLRNPSVPPQTLARGDTLYQVFCAVCHGGAGAGNGPVGMRMGAPSLLTDRARGFSDGFLYSYIKYGGVTIMPAYGDKIFLPADRWAVVNYLRQLQGIALAADTTGRPAVPPSGRPAP
jgi:mono/diheme cytochrome c family protein